MRRVSFALVLLLVFASAATGVQVHASTECERWVSEYRDQLAHSALAKRANAARHRLHHYVQRKVAVLSRPKPHPRTRVLPARLERPKMTREEMLRELAFACGDLPIEPVELNKTVAFEPAPVLGSSLISNDDWTPGPQGLFASTDEPEQSAGWNPGLGGIGGGGGAPGWGGGGGGGVGGGGGNNPPTGGPGGNNPPGGPPTPPPPTAVAPEPGSLLLVGTGVLGAVSALRRRWMQAA